MPVFFLRYFIKQSITVFGGGKEVKISLQILPVQRVSRCAQLKTITVPFQLNQKLSEQVRCVTEQTVTIYWELHADWQQFIESEDSTFSSWTSPSPPSCREVKQSITVKTYPLLCVQEMSLLGLFSTQSVFTTLTVLAELSMMASVVLHGLPLLPPGRVCFKSVGYLPEFHPGVVGRGWGN